MTGETNATINNLPADTFYVEITDAHGCTVDTNKILIEPASRVKITIQSFTDVACYGESTGSATASSSDGTPAYNYQWYYDSAFTNPISGETNATINNLPADTFYVKVNDANGCDDDTSVAISQPVAALTASATDDTLKCFGDTTGTSIATAAGGTTPYAYQWFRDAALTDTIIGEITDTIKNLTQGTYYVEITDFNGCTASDNAVVTQPTELSSTIIDSTMSCGSFPVIQAGQTFLPDGTGATYTSKLTYSEFQAGDTIKAASDIESMCMKLEHSYASDLTVVLKCPNGDSVILADQAAGNNYLGEPVRKVGEFPDLNTVAGNGYNYCFSPTALTTWDDSADDTTYSYVDNDGNSHTNQPFIPAGTYKAESSFDNFIGCPLNGDWKIEITDHNAGDNGYLFSWGLNFNPDIFPPNYSNGRAAVSASGGIPDYTFLWSNGHTNDTITDLSADYYTVTVTDANGCKSEATAHVKDVDIQIDSVVTDVVCSGDNTGSATVTATGGNEPYLYQWEDGFTGQTHNSLSSGTYKITVTDNNSCEYVDSVIVGYSHLLTATFTDSSQTSCNSATTGSHFGSATITPNGTGPYSYLWSSGETDSIATKLISGWNTVTVTDASCTYVDSIKITEPPVLTASISDETDVLCNSDTTGVAIVTPSGGTPFTTGNSYTYAWSDGQTDSTAVNLGAGNYQVTVSDSNMCEVQTSVDILEPHAISVILSQTPAGCTDSTGTATATPSGGVSPYTVSWSHSSWTVDSVGTTIHNLWVDSYGVEITDANGCTLDTTIIIENNSDLTITGFDTTSVSCNGTNDGTAKVNVSNGVQPYSFVWSDSPATTKENITGLYGDSLYTVTVTDANQCSTIDNISVSEPAVLVANIVHSTDVDCHGANTGSVTVSGSGGTKPYTYLWEDALGQAVTTDSIAKDIMAGDYYVTVTDAHSCEATTSVTINQPTKITATLQTTQTTCGGSSGTAIITPAGGTPFTGVHPYTYNWSSGSTDSTATGLSVDVYYVTVTDANGCELVDTVNIIDNSTLTAKIDSTNDISCNGLCDGKAYASASQGTAPYQFEWSNGDNGHLADSLCEDSYTVTVTDANTCSRVLVATITQPTALQVSSTTTNLACNGNNSGKITVEGVGGTKPYSYLWEDGQTDSIHNNLKAGDYHVTVYDANSCTAFDSFTLTEPDAITATYTTTKSGCGDSTGTASVTNISGGVAPYTVSWSHSSWTVDSVGTTIHNLWVDLFNVTITDATGCSKDTTITIEDNSNLTIAIDSVDNVSCNGLCNGKAYVSAQNGTSPYTFSWSNGDAGQSSENLCEGSYTVTVVDKNTCSRVKNIDISEPEILEDSIVFNNPIVCASDTVADLSVIAKGGTRPYVYLWKDASDKVVSTDSSANNLKAGTYYLTVTDLNNCQTTDSVKFIHPTPMVITLSNGKTHCPEDSSGWAKVNVTGGVLPYTYHWTIVGNSDSVLVNGNTDSISNLTVNLYKIDIIDSLGCTHTDTVEIQDDSGIDYNINVLNNITCIGRCDGSAVVEGMAGGTSPYTFLWGNGETTQTANSLCIGATTITVTDAATCKRVKTVNISDEDVLTAYITHNNDFSHDGEQCTGSATVHATGGNPPYTYLWDDHDGTTDSSVYHLCVGVYHVTVLDSNPYTSCQFVDSVEITNDILRYDTVQISYEACYGDSMGSVTVQAHGGYPGSYNYAWANKDWSSYPTADSLTQSISNLKAGWYCLTITDAGNGVLTDSIEIKEPNKYIPAYTIDSTHCSTPTGILSVNELLSTGGTSPFNYEWSNEVWSSYPNADSTGISIRNLGVGKYFVTITDANGCIVDDSINMPDNSKFKLNPRIITPVQCYGWSNGSAYANPNNGVAPYIFKWDDASVTDTITNLMSGTYHVTVTDNETCERIDSVTLSQPDQITFSVKDTVPINCYDSCTGAITVYNVKGGNAGSYSYILKKGFDNTEYTTPKLDNICSGNYQIFVKDILGCLSEGVNYTTLSPTEIKPIFDTHNARCNANVNNGSISVSVTGGTPSMVASPTFTYDYLWSNGDTTKTITNLYSGNYYLTVTDSNKCVKVDSVMLGADTSVYVFAGIYGSTVTDTTICPGTSIRLYADGTSPDSLAWTPANLIQGRSDTIIPLAVPDKNPTTYYLKAYKGTCYNTDSITLGLYPLIQISAGEDSTIFQGKEIHLMASGGTDTTTYYWTGRDFQTRQDTISPIVKPQDTTVYVVIAKTGVCSTSDSVKIIVLGKFNPPTGFTPNGDGYNDTWMLPGISGYKNVDVQIFNRWGEKVYHSSGEYKPWDGRNNNKKVLPIGTYYYVISYSDDQTTKTVSGPITILR